MPRFIVDLGDMKLTDEEQAAIAASIQKLVLDHLASHAQPAQQLGAYIPVGWRGIVYRPNLTELENADRQIQQFATSP